MPALLDLVERRRLRRSERREGSERAARRRRSRTFVIGRTSWRVRVKKLPRAYRWRLRGEGSFRRDFPSQEARLRRRAPAARSALGDALGRLELGEVDTLGPCSSALQCRRSRPFGRRRSTPLARITVISPWLPSLRYSSWTVRRAVLVDLLDLVVGFLVHGHVGPAGHRRQAGEAAGVARSTARRGVSPAT